MAKYILMYQHSLRNSTIKKDKFKLKDNKHMLYKQIQVSKEYWHQNVNRINSMKKDNNNRIITVEEDNRYRINNL